MTTKRKQILKAMAFASCTTMDDLALSTGLERKNLHDNVKASIREDLCERIRDDVTGLPAYKLTTKGRQWLENDKDNSSSVKPQPAVGKNTGSQDKGTRVASGDVCADPLPMGKAVPAPPKPDDLPVAAGADEKIKDLQAANDWLRAELGAANDEIDRLRAGPNPTRYIVTDTYLMADSEEQAREIALELGKELPINTSVIVFQSHKARELRINWRDA